MLALLEVRVRKEEEELAELCDVCMKVKGGELLACTCPFAKKFGKNFMAFARMTDTLPKPPCCRDAAILSATYCVTE